MVQFLNPSTVHTPQGSYSHTAAVPAGSELIFVSGQVGMRPDGSIPGSVAEQAEAVFSNLAACLAAHGLGMDAIVKLTAYLVAGVDVDVVRKTRLRHLGDHRPTSTLVFVPGLASPDFLLEVEAIAVKGAP
ncbi:RidA family protein [Ramlibacter pallidus]|uniref:RidA family protein n=1 Tax=Ramlibacter pallidus TaxID=2780087 RepID=A0ABR9S3Z2_9BURK|nr:RidA family protein [Ramlibacter pallidus]MBE7368017.1 RidA family protein [Ramlibacter pallidus]